MRGFALLVVLALPGACAGDVAGNGSGDGPTKRDGAPPHDGPKTGDRAPAGETSPPPAEAGPPPGPCDPFEKAAGFSCAGGQQCPTGFQPATLGGNPCTCHVPCDPDQGQKCQPTECGRLCVQLTDSQGNPIPKLGVCVADPGAPEGEPCTPSCQIDLYCVTFIESIAYCRRGCGGPQDCPGYKMVCVPLTGGQSVCVPGGATVGPKEGEPCAEPQSFCLQGLICDPQSQTCLKACDPNAGGCAAPKTCQKIVDPGPNVTLGYGCQ